MTASASPDRNQTGTVGQAGRLPDHLVDLPGHIVTGDVGDVLIARDHFNA
jgi:hypothetical protein